MRRVVQNGLKILVSLVMILSITGCNIISTDSFVFHGAEVVDFNMNEGAVVEMTVENTSIFTAHVVGGELTAYLHDEPIGSIYIKNPVKFPRKETVTVTLELGFKFDSPMAVLKALKALASSPDKITISGYGEGKVWFFHKRFERRDVPLSKFIAIFGNVTDYITI